MIWIKLLNLNSCTTVVVDGAQSVYTTSSNGLDLIAAYTHLNELVSNGLSTLLRQLLVQLSATSLAISITSDNNLSVVILGNLSEIRNVLQILLRGNLRLTNVEEYRYGSCDNLGLSNNLGLRILSGGLGLVSQQVLQASVLSLSVRQLSVQSVDLTL